MLCVAFEVRHSQLKIEFTFILENYKVYNARRPLLKKIYIYISGPITLIFFAFFFEKFLYFFF